MFLKSVYDSDRTNIILISASDDNQGLNIVIVSDVKTKYQDIKTLSFLRDGQRRCGE